MFDQELLNSLFRYCSSLTNEPDSAYDLLQSSIEKYLKIEQKKAKQEQSTPSNPKAYLFRIIRNTFIDQLRKQKGKIMENFEESDEGGYIKNQEFQALDDLLIEREMLKDIIQHLKANERELLFLWAIEGYTIQEIADHMDVPRGTLLSQLHRLRKKIQAQFSPMHSPQKANA